MAKMTTAQLRELEVKRLHAIKGSTSDNVHENYNKNYWTAANISIYECEEERHIMNAFYRLSGLSERKCYYDNGEELATGKAWAIRRAEELEQKEERAIKRLNEKLKNYGLTIGYSGIYPRIIKLDKNNGYVEIIQAWYY